MYAWTGCQPIGKQCYRQYFLPWGSIFSHMCSQHSLLFSQRSKEDVHCAAVTDMHAAKVVMTRRNLKEKCMIYTK
ncbi:hypothetical protein BDR03DRAFT_947319 [Suillus americanus]|nr:hypothetical protein BDR03DRAFT_947319 [Suillus americanus]